MRFLESTIVVGIAFVCLGAGDYSYDSAGWKTEIAAGRLPYRQLVAGDFAIDDKAHPGYGLYTEGFCRYYYKYQWTMNNGRAVARVTEWTVRSGFDRNKSSRKSWFKLIQETLSHEQGHLDISEIHGRRLAALSLSELPWGDGKTQEEAAERLKSKLETLQQQKLRESQAEQDVYDAATNHGKNAAAQREWNKKIEEGLKQTGVKPP